MTSFQCRLDNPVLDRRYAQRRVRPSPFGISTRLTAAAVTAVPQPIGKLTQVQFRLPLEPFHALPIDTRGAAVGPDFRPSHLQRCGCSYLCLSN